MVIMHFLVCDFKRTAVVFAPNNVLRYVASFRSVVDAIEKRKKIDATKNEILKSLLLQLLLVLQ